MQGEDFGISEPRGRFPGPARVPAAVVSSHLGLTCPPRLLVWEGLPFSVPVACEAFPKLTCWLEQAAFPRPREDPSVTQAELVPRWNTQTGSPDPKVFVFKCHTYKP